MKTWFNRFFDLTLLIALVVGAAVACGKTPGPAGDGKLDVVVSIVPQRYFVERIGGDYVTVSVMVEPGNSPVTYEPKPEQLKALSGVRERLADQDRRGQQGHDDGRHDRQH
jgi:ABC-type Zn uptake system ZnuABC Zn-binding protein ZnuA